jgi:hypothetical protein
MKITKLWHRYLVFLVTGIKLYGGSSAPAPPDPKKTAAAQLDLNKKTSAFEAAQNRYDMTNPFGTVTWQNSPTKTVVGVNKNKVIGYTGKGKNKKPIYAQKTELTPHWSQTTKLSDSQQNIYNNQQGIQQQAGQAALGMMPGVQARLAQSAYDPQADLADIQGRVKGLKMPGEFTGSGDFGLMDRLNPSLQQDENALRARLANQGLQYGSEAYGNAMRDQSQRTNDARLAVVGQGGQEMQRAYDMDLGKFNANMGRYGQGLQGLGQEAGIAGDRVALDSQARNQRLAELSAMIQSSGSVNLPTYQGAQNVGGIASPDIAGLTASNYQGKIAGMNANVASNNAALGAAGQLGAALASRKY